MSDYFVHESSYVDMPCDVGKGTKIWHFSHVMKNAVIGKNCTIGQNVNVAGGVVIGDNVKIQNNVSIYTGTNIEDDVFLGPSCVLTNVSNPRSQVNRQSIYEKTLVKKGASIGANATIVCGISIGRYAFIAAGAVVTKDVPDYGFIVGVPGKQKGWISRHGIPLGEHDASGTFVCKESGWKYKIIEGIMKCIDCDEDDTIPSELSNGSKAYRDVK